MATATSTSQISNVVVARSEMRKTTQKHKKPIIIDGRTLEGGGQLVRNSICLSALTGTPVQIDNIRANRKGGGGLANQHLACVRWLAHASRARLKGAERKSKTLLFEPKCADGIAEHLDYSPAFKKVLKDGELWYESAIDIESAGSTGLALQAILPFILFSRLPTAVPIRLTLTGGTNVSASPSYDYIAQVLLPTLRSLGFPEIKAQIHRRGWTHGSVQIGSFSLEIPPREEIVLPAFSLSTSLSQIADRKQRIPSRLHATFLAPELCHAQLQLHLPIAIAHAFGSSVGLSMTCEPSGHAKRMYLILIAEIPTDPAAGTNVDVVMHLPSARLARDWLYDRKISSHDVATTEMIERVTKELAAEIRTGTVLDTFMRDQLVIFQALAHGKSVVSSAQSQLSLHAQTAEWVASKLLKVEFGSDGACEGVGFGRENEEMSFERPLESLHLTSQGEEGLSHFGPVYSSDNRISGRGA